LDEDDDYFRPDPSSSYIGTSAMGYNRPFAHKHKLNLDTNISNVKQMRDAIEKLFAEAKQHIGKEDEIGRAHV